MKNPSAFPVVILNEFSGEPCAQEKGMTLLDYFATKAMQSILVVQEQLNISKNEPKGIAWTDKNIARNAYNMAEALLNEREKRIINQK